MAKYSDTTVYNIELYSRKEADVIEKYSSKIMLCLQVQKCHYQTVAIN